MIIRSLISNFRLKIKALTLCFVARIQVNGHPDLRGNQCFTSGPQTLSICYYPGEPIAFLHVLTLDIPD